MLIKKSVISKYICYTIMLFSISLHLTSLGTEKTWAQTIIDKISVGGSPDILEYNPSNGNIYVGNSGYIGNETVPFTVSVIDSTTNKVIHTIHIADVPTSLGPNSLLYNPSNGDIYVVNQDSSTVSVIDNATNNVIHTIKVGQNPNSLLYNPINGNIYVTNEDSSTVSVIDSTTNKVIHTIKVGQNPSNIIYNPINGNIYVTNEDSNDVSVIGIN